LLWVVLQQVPEWSVEGLRALGGLFYIYLAIRLVRTAGTQLAPDMLDVEFNRSYWQAVVAVWITPVAYINWAVIGVPALLTYAEQSLAHVIAFLVGFYAVWVGGLAAQIWIVGQADRVLKTRTVYLVYAGSILLVGFGIYQIWLGLSNILGT
jgi:threonine/homoserine/homoserine lactone efflux protein